MPPQPRVACAGCIPPGLFQRGSASMSRSFPRFAPAFVALTVLVSCADPPTEAMRGIAPQSARLDATPSAPPQYIVLANGNGFSADFDRTVSSLGGTVETLHQGAGIAVVTGLSGLGAAQLSRISGIAEVQADEIVTLAQPIAAANADAPAISDPSASSVANPASGLRFVWQWNMRAISAPDAWAAGGLGDAGVTVAILDTGIDYDAPDLNGLVDLSRSVSFIASDDQVRATFFPTRNNISDFNGHGTNVATQVSSKAVVFAGVTSRTTLIGVKVLGRSGSGPFSAILNGVLWAADHGADVANMSLGGAFAKAGAGRLTSVINRVFNYAKQRGTLIVVAAGNEGADLDHNGNTAAAFCDMVHVVCVAAMGPATATGAVNTPSFFTNFGRSAISVAAPGGNADAANVDPVTGEFPKSAWPWGNDIASWVWSYCSKTIIAGFTANGTPIL